MATIYEVAKAQRELLLARDAALLGQVTRAYGVAYAAILRELKALVDAMAVAEKQGEPVNREWLSRKSRLEALQAQAARSISEFSQGADLSILNGQASAVQLAVEHSSQLMATGAITARASGALAVGLTLNRVPDSALQTLIGSLSDGSPLSELLGTFPAQAAMAVEDGLIEGLALGRSPRETARLMANAMAEGGMLPPGGPSEVMEKMQRIKQRALTIARTETLRSYRIAAHENYNANDDITEGWMWISAHQLRTCPVCWAMHGTIHPLSEIMASHPNCRCTQVPVLKEQFGGPPEDVRTGEEEFSDLTEAEQKFVLGPAKFAAFKAGQIQLANLVKPTVDARWGNGRREATLAELKTYSMAGFSSTIRANDRSLSNAHNIFRGVADDFETQMKVSGPPILVVRPVPGTFGHCNPHRDPMKLAVRTSIPFAKFAAAHEFSHYLDFAYSRTHSSPIFWHDNPIAIEIMKEWRSSPTFSELMRRHQLGEVRYSFMEWADDPHEVFARALSMWMQKRLPATTWGGQMKLVRDFERNQQGIIVHWSDEEFAKIEPLITKLLTERGLLPR